jgi:hypothetical protein
MNLIFITNKFIVEGFAGCAMGPVILIRPEYKNDIGLLEHEKVHRKQWLRTFSIHSFLYLWSDKYKLSAEVEAYKEQAKHYLDDRRPKFAEYIASRYGLMVTKEEALELLLK